MLVSSSLIEKSYNLATLLHVGQTRKSTGKPYMTEHLTKVAEIVESAGGTNEIIAAALLHDAIEDQPQRDPEDRILEVCSEEVLALVKECTEIGPGGEDKAPWRQRKLAYLEHIKVVSAGALLISVADKLQSARDDLLPYVEARGDAFYDIFKKAGDTTAERKENTLWFHRSLVDAFGSRLEALKSTLPRTEYYSIAGLIARFDEIVGSLEEI